MDVNIASPGHKADPYPFYARLRAESPVHRVTLADRRPAWLIARYDDVVAVPEGRAARQGQGDGPDPGAGRQAAMGAGHVPPAEAEHARPRPAGPHAAAGAGPRAFTPGWSRQMRPRIESLADELLDAVERPGRHGPHPRLRPAHPDDDHRRDARRARRGPAPVPPLVQRHRLGHLRAGGCSGPSRASWRSSGTSGGWSRSRRAAPRDDLVSALVQAEEAGEQLSEDELVAMVFLLLVAGHETTVNLIGNGMLALLEHPAQMERLRARPGADQVGRRGAAPLREPAGDRDRAVRPRGRGDRRGDDPAWGAGLRGARLGEPGRAAVPGPGPAGHRPGAEPAPVVRARAPLLPGAPLARLEGQVAIGTLLHRRPGPAPGGPAGSLRWRRGLVLRGLKALPVALSGL